jgi:hypothetical protein
MDNPSIKPASDFPLWGNPTRSSNSLLGLLLSDVATDIEVVARELSLRNEMLERLWRALDRIDCAQSVLEANRGMTRGEMDAGTVDTVSAEMELLAGRWPNDYQDWAVECCLLSNITGHATCTGQLAARPGLKSHRDETSFGPDFYA